MIFSAFFYDAIIFIGENGKNKNDKVFVFVHIDRQIRCTFSMLQIRARIESL